MASKPETRTTISVEVAGRPFPKGHYGVLVRVRNGKKKYDYRVSIEARDADEAGRKAIEMYSSRVGKPAGTYRQVVRF